jgi:hypothetical protein
VVVAMVLVLVLVLPVVLDLQIHIQHLLQQQLVLLVEAELRAVLVELLSAQHILFQKHPLVI